MLCCEFCFGRLGALYMEFPSVSRGRTFLDYLRTDYDLLVWLGALHVLVSRFHPWCELALSDDSEAGPEGKA